MQKIVPSLWSGHEADHMVELYGRAFGATITQEVRYPENPLEFEDADEKDRNRSVLKRAVSGYEPARYCEDDREHRADQHPSRRQESPA